MSAHDFLALYVKDNRVLAVAGVNRDCEMTTPEEMLRLNRMPTLDRLRGGAMNILELLHTPI